MKPFSAATVPIFLGIILQIIFAPPLAYAIREPALTQIGQFNQSAINGTGGSSSIIGSDFYNNGVVYGNDTGRPGPIPSNPVSGDPNANSTNSSLIVNSNNFNPNPNQAPLPQQPPPITVPDPNQNQQQNQIVNNDNYVSNQNNPQHQVADEEDDAIVIGSDDDNGGTHNHHHYRPNQNQQQQNSQNQHHHHHHHHHQNIEEDDFLDDEEVEGSPEKEEDFLEDEEIEPEPEVVPMVIEVPVVPVVPLVPVHHRHHHHHHHHHNNNNGNNNNNNNNNNQTNNGSTPPPAKPDGEDPTPPDSLFTETPPPINPPEPITFTVPPPVTYTTPSPFVTTTPPYDPTYPPPTFPPTTLPPISNVTEQPPLNLTTIDSNPSTRIVPPSTTTLPPIIQNSTIIVPPPPNTNNLTNETTTVPSNVVTTTELSNLTTIDPNIKFQNTTLPPILISTTSLRPQDEGLNITFNVHTNFLSNLTSGSGAEAINNQFRWEAFNVWPLFGVSHRTQTINASIITGNGTVYRDGINSLLVEGVKAIPFFGVEFTPYVRSGNFSHGNYTQDEIKAMLSIILTKVHSIQAYDALNRNFTNVIGGGLGNEPSTSPVLYIAPAAAELNNETNYLSLSILQSANVLEGDAQPNIEQALETAQEANQIYAGTVLGITLGVASAKHGRVEDVKTGQLVLAQASKYEKKLNLYSLKLGAFVDVCEEIDGQNSEVKNMLIELAKALDYLVCSIYPQQPVISSEQYFQNVTAIYGRVNKAFLQVNSNVEIAVSTGLTSEGVSRKNPFSGADLSSVNKTVDFWERMEKWSQEKRVAVYMHEAFDVPEDVGGEDHDGYWRMAPNNNDSYIDKSNGQVVHYLPKQGIYYNY